MQYPIFSLSQFIQNTYIIYILQIHLTTDFSCCCCCCSVLRSFVYIHFSMGESNECMTCIYKVLVFLLLFHLWLVLFSCSHVIFSLDAFQCSPLHIRALVNEQFWCTYVLKTIFSAPNVHFFEKLFSDWFYFEILLRCPFKWSVINQFVCARCSMWMENENRCVFLCAINSRANFSSSRIIRWFSFVHFIFPNLQWEEVFGEIIEFLSVEWHRKSISKLEFLLTNSILLF